MPNSDINILAIERGTITAPAGCGKTHLISDALACYTGKKAILVLTHTNAGVAALRQRLAHANVSSKIYQLSTIDGWAMQLISRFPMRSGHKPTILDLATPQTDYRDIRNAASELLESGHVTDIIKASYAHLLVDEYQDCSVEQHKIVVNISQILPTCVLGDPMQAIFGFGNNKIPDWNNEVCKIFPVVKELDQPWRWIKADAEPLGKWLLDVRTELLHKRPVDLRTAPLEIVRWVELESTKKHEQQLEAACIQSPSENGCVLIIGESTSPNSQRQFASQTPGATAVEAVDLKDLIGFAKVFDPTASHAMEHLVKFAQNIMTNVIDINDLNQRTQSLSDGTASSPTSLERAAFIFTSRPSYHAAANLLLEINRESGVHLYRPAILRACIKALQFCGGTEGLSFYDAAVKVREENRLMGRSLPKRAVGSTLLLKGLEAEVVVILDANTLNTRNLYVAMTRGSKLLVVCSPTPILNPQRLPN